MWEQRCFFSVFSWAQGWRQVCHKPQFHSSRQGWLCDSPGCLKKFPLFLDFFFLWMNARLYWKDYQHLLRRANNSSFPSVYTWVLPMKSPRVLCPGILCTVSSRHISFHSLKFLCPITTSSSFLLKWWASRLPLGHRQGWGLSRRYRDVWRRCGVRDGSPGSSSVPGLEQQHGFLTLKTSLGRQWQLPWATPLL